MQRAAGRDEDKSGVKFFCHNAKYMNGRGLAMQPQCKGCRWEANDVLIGSDRRTWVVWYCDFAGAGTETPD